MSVALSAARRSVDFGEVPIGALVTLNSDVVAIAHNLTRYACDPSGHAEIAALRIAARHLGRWVLDDCDLHVTLEPCAMCAQAISNARIRRLYYAAVDKKSGGVENGARVFEQATCHHKPEIYPGIAESESTTLLQAFFQQRR